MSRATILSSREFLSPVAAGTSAFALPGCGNDDPARCTDVDLSVEVPAGQHELTLDFVGPGVGSAGVWASGVGFLLVGGAFFIDRHRGRR